MTRQSGPLPARAHRGASYDLSSLPTSNPNGQASVAPMLSASPSNNHSLFSFGRNGDTAQRQDTSGSFDFLPSVSFDDLHSSIESASTEFKLTQFPSPPGEGGPLGLQNMAQRKMAERPYVSQSNSGGGISNVSRVGIPAAINRPGRSGSLLRRGSLSNRQASTSSIASSASGHGDAHTVPAGLRTRRQSHYPPVSTTNIAKPPRKSMGPGVLGDTPDIYTGGQRRTPSFLADRGHGDTTRLSMDHSAAGSDTRYTQSSRATKAKSVQPPPRSSQANLLLGESLAPDHNRLSTLAPRSPRAGGKASTPSSAKRSSVMPGSHQASHASGLGARTISPTDTKRAKRMSVMPQSHSLNHIINVPPPPPVSMQTRADSRSPSMIPRRTSITPSSARTTPDVQRKSHSSALSVNSTMSFNTVRTSTGSLQPRLPQSTSGSRLPAPKHTVIHNPVSHDDEEFVPPVPAIPKAYESPKGSPAEMLFLEKKRVLNGVDAASVTSHSTGSISMPVHPEPVKVQRKPSGRKGSYMPATGAALDKPATPVSKRSLQPLSLPPINLGPLNIPNVVKTPSMPHDTSAKQRMVTPPASRQIPKTPTTPMTASRSAFFSKSRYDTTMELPPLRSSSSVMHLTNRGTPSPPPDNSSYESTLALTEPAFKPTISPFLSSSAPKASLDYGFLKRPNIEAEHTTTTTTTESMTSQKPAGPRAPQRDRSVPKSPPPRDSIDEPATPATPSSMSSLRRKLSLSWKRKEAKANAPGSSEASEKSSAQQPLPQEKPHSKQPQPQVPSRQDSMPPPRIPVSATTGSLNSVKQSSPSPVIKANGGYLESRRRKSSAASLSSFPSHERTKSETWTSKKETPDPAATPTSRNTSMMNRILKPKSSTIGRGDHWTAELDKDDMAAEEEMRKMGSRRKETEIAAKTIDALRKRAIPKERVGPHEAIRIAMLNIYERGEIVDFGDVYFCGTQNANKVVGDLHSSAPNFGYDDERGDYTIIPGDHLSYRYEIVDILGKGSFGQVVRCIDHKLGVLVAVKIIRNKKRFHQQALVEVNILQKLREWDPRNKHSMVSFTQSFYFRGHLCISTELLDMNLYEFIKTHSFRGFSLRIVRRFTKQILSSLILLKQHKVIHCDLKPENILLRHPLHSEIKVIDFGSSCFETEKVYTYIQSRFYRSPEVILGMTYGMPIDMWSVGCILAELFTGVPIFPGENEQEQLACIMEVFGPPEKHLIEKSTRKKLFFDSMGKPRLTVSSKGRRRRPSSKTLQQALKCDDDAFLDFITRCLRWDPDRRLKPEDAVNHEFITGRKMVPAHRIPTRDSSPVKRHNTISVPRPLPEPPISKGITAMRTGPSPHKPVATRRASGATAPTTASNNKRASTSNSTGTINMGSSNLPRAAGRTASGKQDLAAAGATAAMSRKV